MNHLVLGRVEVGSTEERVTFHLQQKFIQKQVTETRENKLTAIRLELHATRNKTWEEVNKTIP